MGVFNMRLKEEMKKQGLSQHGLATLSGLSRSTIADYSSRDVKPSYEKLLALSKALGVELEYLNGDSDVRIKNEKYYDGIGSEIEYIKSILSTMNDEHIPIVARLFTELQHYEKYSENNLISIIESITLANNEQLGDISDYINFKLGRR